MENVEQLLSMWFKDQSQLNVPLSVSIIQEKAKSLITYSVKKAKALKWKSLVQVNGGL
jgi:U3 small nucleolar RNA-associated protein 14